MTTLHRIRKHRQGLARLHLALFALVWVSLFSTTCALAMELEAAQGHHHDCPHCPPRPCHEVQPEECKAPDSLDSPRLSESSSQCMAPAAATSAPTEIRIRDPQALAVVDHPPARAGPRAHLLHVQFNE